jgi:hypothetical protein
MKRAFKNHPYDEDLPQEKVSSEIFHHGAEALFSLPFALKKGEAESLNQYQKELHKRDNRIIPFAAIHKDDDDPLLVIKRAVNQYGLKGLKFHPMVQRWSPTAPSLAPVYDFLNEQKLPVFLHTGYDSWYGYKLHAKDLEHLARTYIHIPFILVHSIFPQFDLARNLLENYSNIMLDATNVFGSFIMMYGRDKSRLSKQQEVMDFLSLLSDFKGRIMFGTDHPVGMSTVQGIYNDISLFDIEEQDLFPLVYGTARHLMKSNLDMP